MDFESFIEHCEKGICLRNTFITNNCIKESKRRNCYKKYIKKVEEQIESYYDNANASQIRWQEVKEQLIERDNNTCQLWKILSKDEQLHILHNYFEDYSQLSKQLDPAHIVPRSRSNELYYDVDNLVLISRYFHSLLDTWKHPVYRTTITDDERTDWYIKAKDQKKE